MISVVEALNHLFDLVAPVGIDEVPLGSAAGRVLARDVRATRDQPPFAASAMDGYAIRSSDLQAGAMLRVIGEAAAGHGYSGTLGPGEALRIFTGAPVPEGADHVVIQEDTERDGDQIFIGQDAGTKPNIRPAGDDFRQGDLVKAPRLLGPGDIALLASMNIDRVPVRRKPVIALMATGDELVMPGENPGPDQIIASNSFGLQAMFQAAGAEVRMLPIARDTEPALRYGFSLAADADLVITIGGASVGDHDLVGQVAADLGLERSFYKIAMRPGKPLMAGRLAGSAMVGLPGNPVSAMVCGQIFVLPMLRAYLGFNAEPHPRLSAELAAPLAANGQREHYMRARLENGRLVAFNRQDSALLGVLSAATALIVRPPGDPARNTGDAVSYIPL